MAHFKRKKARRNVRCTMCTPVRWLGNNKGRRPHRDVAMMQPRLLEASSRSSS